MTTQSCKQTQVIPKYQVGQVLRLCDSEATVDFQIREIKLFPPRILYLFNVVGGKFPFPSAAYFEGELDRFGVNVVGDK